MQTYSNPSFHHDEIRERAKLEGHHLPEEELTSQPSTMHSLGSVEDHHFSPTGDTPNKTPKVSGFAHHVKEEVHDQASQIKSMLRMVFGEKVNSEHDNSESTKEQVKKINNEIKQLPKREEQVVESQGRGYSKEEDQHGLNQALSKINEMRDRVHQYKSGLQQSQGGESEEIVNPSRDLQQESREQLKQMNEDIKKLPHNENIIEGQGQAKEEESSGKHTNKHDEKDLWEIAFHKIDEMKQRAREKGQEFKNQADLISHKASELHQIPAQQEHPHHHLSAESQSFQPSEHSKMLAETIKEGFKDSSVPLIEKIEKFEDQWKHTHEEPEGSQKESQQNLEKPQEGENKEISAESKQEVEKVPPQEDQERSEEQIVEKEEREQKEKSKEREPLLDKVFNRIQAISDNYHNTVEGIKSTFRVEERNQESQENEGEGKKREPILDKVLNRINTVSHNIHHTYADIRDALHVEDRNRDQNLEEKVIIPKQEVSEEGYHIRERITEQIYNVSGIISHNLETVKGRIASSVENVKGRLNIRRSKDEGYHKVTGGFSKSVKQYTHETKHFKPYKSQNPFQVLVDENEPEYESDEEVVKESLVKKIKQRFSNGMNYLKSKLAFKRKGTVKKVKQEQEKEKQSLRNKVRQGLEAISLRISQNIEGVKGRFSKDMPLPDQEVIDVSDQEEEVEDRSPLKENVKEDLQTIPANPMKSKSQKRLKKTKKVENLKNKSSEKKENWEDFHDISHGFSKSVAEFERERRGPAVISSNLFDSLSAKAMSQSARKIKPRKEVPIKSKKPRAQSLHQKEENNAKDEENFHEISHGISESAEKFQRELRGAPLVSRNPFSSLFTQNVKKIEKRGKALVQKAKRTVDKAKRNIRSRISNENKENIAQNE